jgi:hypothetical protein
VTENPLRASDAIGASTSTLDARARGVDQDLKNLAGRFLEFVYEATGLPMIVCDEKGTIVHAVDRKRVGTQHAGAQRIVRRDVDEVFVTEEEAARDPRMKVGCNVAIDFDGKRVGTFGLAGPLEIAQPLTRLATAVIVSWLKEQRQQAALKLAAGEVVKGVQGVSARTQSAGAEAASVGKLMATASREASEKVRHTDAIVRTVQEIAQKSRILSINGSVEAARAGEYGRGFAVVAREMLDLAESARGAANQIQATLGEVQRAIAELQGAIDRSAGLAQGQATALIEVGGVVQGLQQAVVKLARSGDARA